MKRFSGVLSWIKAHKKISIGIGVGIFLLILLLRPKPPKPIDTMTVTRGDITTSVTATGTVDAEKSVDLRFLTGGLLTYLGVKKGDSVKAGQLIATLDERTAEKNLQTSLRNYSEQRNSFDQTAEDNGNRTIPDQAVNDAMKRILQNNQYDLEKAVLSVELQDLAKQNSVLTTPISGVVIRADPIIAGKNVSATDTFTVADLTTLEFKVDVDEADIGKVVSGQPVKITLDAFPDTTISLPVTDIDFASHTTTTGGNAYTVTASLAGAGISAYRIGMTGDAEIITAERKDVLTIPTSALNDDNTVFIEEGKRFKKTKVTLGLQNDTEVEVTSGLSSGDKIALQASDVKPANIAK